MKINEIFKAAATAAGAALITVSVANAAGISPKVPPVGVYAQEMDAAFSMNPIPIPIQPGSPGTDPFIDGGAYPPSWNAWGCSGSISCTGGPATPPTCTATITCGSITYDGRSIANAVNPKPWLGYENYFYKETPEGGPIVSPYNPGQGGPLVIFTQDNFGTMASSGRPVGMPHPRPRGG